MKKLSKKLSNSGGSAWESNPPKALFMPPNGFEVREAHRDSSAPNHISNKVYITSIKSAMKRFFNGEESVLLEKSGY